MGADVSETVRFMKKKKRNIQDYGEQSNTVVLQKRLRIAKRCVAALRGCKPEASWTD